MGCNLDVCMTLGVGREFWSVGPAAEAAAPAGRITGVRADGNGDPRRDDAGAAADLLSELVARPWDFDFFQAVRRLEGAFPARPPVGSSTRLADDTVRFGQSPSLRFEPATVAACAPSGEGQTPRLVVQFMGLCGPQGPMPLHVTEYLRDRERNHADPAPSRFFDLFNHRMVAGFYRGWALNQQTVSFERSFRRPPGRARTGDHYAVYVASLFGTGMESLRE